MKADFQSDVKMGKKTVILVIAACLLFSNGVQSSIAKNSPIKLNVGGHHFITSLETLSESKKLKSMFQNEKSLPPKDDEGRYFIDHDGEMFKYILRYLRTGNLTFPLDFIDGEILEKAAEFYQIDRLQAALESGVSKTDVILYLVTNGCDKNLGREDMSLQISQGSITWHEIFHKFEPELQSHIDYVSNTSFGVQFNYYYDYDVTDVPFNLAITKIKSQDFFFTSDDLNLKYKILKILLTAGFSFVKDMGNNSAAKECAYHLSIDSTLEMYLLERIRPLTD